MGSGVSMLRHRNAKPEPVKTQPAKVEDNTPDLLSMMQEASQRLSEPERTELVVVPEQKGD